MQERLIVAATELTIIRLLCRKEQCRGVFELPIEQMGRVAVYELICPACGNAITRPEAGGAHPLLRLKQAMLDLREQTDHYAVEFILPAPPPKV